MADVRARIVEHINAERRKQDAKWGDQRHLSLADWHLILSEEVGEVARAILEPNSWDEADWAWAITEELIQVAAVAISILEQSLVVGASAGGGTLTLITAVQDYLRELDSRKDLNYRRRVDLTLKSLRDAAEKEEARERAERDERQGKLV